MARPKRICSITDCNKPAHGRGWCSDHYARWMRHGDPEAGRTTPGELERYYQEVVLPYQGDDCLIWPYSRSCGYGYVSTDAGRFRVHRLACEALQGPPPTPDHEAARVQHGTSTAGSRHPLARLDDDEIRTIRSLKGKVTQRVLASRYGITQSQVSHIHTGKRWGHLDGVW